MTSYWYSLVNIAVSVGVVIGSWMLRVSVAYEAGMGVSTVAARDVGGAIGRRQESEWCKSFDVHIM